MKGFFGEFRAFISRGNVIDLAVGIIIGAAFTSIVNSLVNDVVMPPIGLVLGQVDFSSLFIALDGKEYQSVKAAKDAGAPVIAYGLFINACVQFLIVAFVVFNIVRQVNRLRVKEKAEAEAAPTPPPDDVVLLTEIRDLLKAQQAR
ncbi:large conductance mechanosensitive channel protein MscL [Zavarzinia sp. CC-PAN008]|uniref:large conductance mechanosensitive channel protein MscL n=1 Tax=Zavarzinia sp. CC-PAN008 TaxID=3243332 RepID=UPI003F74AADB